MTKLAISNFVAPMLNMPKPRTATGAVLAQANHSDVTLMPHDGTEF